MAKIKIIRPLTHNIAPLSYAPMNKFQVNHLPEHGLHVAENEAYGFYLIQGRHLYFRLCVAIGDRLKRIHEDTTHLRAGKLVNDLKLYRYWLLYHGSLAYTRDLVEGTRRKNNGARHPETSRREEDCH